MAQKISQMTEQTTSSMTEAGTSDFLGGYTATGGNANRKFSLSGLANYFLNKFKMTLGGSSQTVKSAIDTLNSKLYNYIGSFNSLSALETALDTLGGTVTERGSQNLSFYINTAFGLFSTSIYVGYMTKTGTNRYQLLMSENASNRKIYATKTANGWVWEIAPMRSEIDTLNSKMAIQGNILDLATKTIHANVLFLCRYFNGNTKTAIYMTDFSNTIYPCLNTFASGEIEVTYANTSGFTVKNNLSGVITYYAFLMTQ